MTKLSGKRETLAEFVQRARREKGLSLKDVERQSGGRISSGYVSQIENAFACNPSMNKLRILAAVLRVSEDALFAAARGAREPKGFTESQAYALYEAYEEIESPAHREVVDAMIDGVLRSIDALPKKKKAGGAQKALRRSR